MDENLQNQNFKHEFFAQQNKLKRDYDKEPLVLRDYLGWQSFLNAILTILYWAASTFYLLNKLHDLEKGYLSTNDFINSIIALAIITFLLFLLEYLNFSTIKIQYTYFYTSKAIFYDSNSKIADSYFFANNGYAISLCPPYTNDTKHTKVNEGKFIFGSFLYRMAKVENMRYFGFVLLGAFIFVSLDTKSYWYFLIGMLVVVFMTLLTEFLETMVCMGIYKRENKSLKNFWKYARKFQISIRWESANRWEPTEFITMFFFNEKDHDDLREYVLTVFHRDIDENFKYTSFQ